MRKTPSGCNPFIRTNSDAGKSYCSKYGPVYLLHRIIRIEASQLYIRGDNRVGFPLEIVDKDAIVGYVISIRRGTRWMPPEHFGWQLISSLLDTLLIRWRSDSQA